MFLFGVEGLFAVEFVGQSLGAGAYKSGWGPAVAA
jgi:hypothetical protein